MSTLEALPIAPDHPAFAGHFPGMPIFPGAALLDLTLDAIQRSHQLDLAVWRVTSAKFLHFVRPGDAPVLEHAAASPTLIRFTVRVAERTVATGSLAREPGA